MAGERVLAVSQALPVAAGEVDRLAGALRDADAGCDFVDPAGAQQALQRREPAPGVVVLLPSVAAPLPLARAAHAAWPDAYLLIVRAAPQVPEFRRSLGLAPLLGRHWSVAADTEQELAAACRQALATGRQRRQLRTALAGVNARLAETRSVSLGDYQRLAAAEQHLSNFLRFAQVAVLGVDRGGRVLFWSDGVAQLFGIPAEQAVGRPVQELGAWSELVAEGMRRLEPQHGRQVVEQLVDLGGRRRALEAVVLPGGPDGSFSVLLRDVTARRQAQDRLQLAHRELQEVVSRQTQELEQSQLALLQAQKLEALGKLTGGVAHDFNNVLQVIGSNLQLLQPLVQDRAQADQLLRSALAAVDRGAKLSSQLLAFARRQPLNPLPLNVNRRVREMDELLRRALGEQVQIETVLAGGLWTTLADGHQLENVILNLAINSRDAMPQGGKLTLETANVYLDEHYTEQFTDLAPGQYVMLAVSDTGCGMPPEVAARAFEPFYTTKPEGKGTGLGLSMAYGFAKQSGGHIRIYSEPGEGTTIKLYLPRSLEKEVVPPRPQSGPVQGGTETILVVEDDLAVQAAVVGMLQGLGYRVLRASDAQAALNILEGGVHVDLLFTDVVMPGPLRSPELARRARVLLPDIVVLFTSGYTQNAIVHGGRLDPGVELLSKPYRQEDLARRIRGLLRGRASAPAVDAGRKLRVLLVEDEPDQRDITRQMLELMDCEVQAVPSAEAAEEAMRQAAFDLLMTDHSLPGRSGADLARASRVQQPGMEVVIASGYAEMFADEGLRSLAKPYGLAELRGLLDEVRARRR